MEKIFGRKSKAIETPHINIVDYVRNSGVGFVGKPFTVADSLVFSQAAYWHFDGIVGSFDRRSPWVRLGDLNRPGLIYRIIGKQSHAEDKTRLLEAMVSSPRFANCKMNYYVNILEPVLEKQFSAVTFLLPDHSLFVAYRGTDNTLTGWKENFNMAFRSPVPAQQSSVDYLSDVMKRTVLKFPKEVRVGGHSKGGNLAVYAAVYSDERIKKKLTAVYSHDGPGFKSNIFKTPEYMSIASRIHMLLPKDSMIGTLLTQNTGYKVVESNAEGFDQHNPFTWQFMGGDFVYADRLSSGAERFDRVLDKWLGGMSDARREFVVESLFDIIDYTKAKSFDEVIDIVTHSEMTVVRSLRAMAAEDRRELLKAFAALGKAYAET